MSQPLDALTKSLLQAARNAGADGADAKAERATSISVDVRGGALEQAERSEGVDIGLRVFVGQRSASVSASDTSATHNRGNGSPRRGHGPRSPRRPLCGSGRC